MTTTTTTLRMSTMKSELDEKQRDIEKLAQKQQQEQQQQQQTTTTNESESC